MSFRSPPTVRTGRHRRLHIEYVAPHTWALIETEAFDPAPKVIALSDSRWDLERRVKAERRRRRALLHVGVHSLIWIGSLLGVVVASHLEVWFSPIAVVAASLLSLLAMGMISASVATVRRVESARAEPPAVNSAPA